MSSFLSGLMSVGKKVGKGVEDWAQGTQIGRDIDKGRGSTNPWSGSKPAPASQGPSGKVKEVPENKGQGA